jgi:hypothetical protein
MVFRVIACVALLLSSSLQADLSAQPFDSSWTIRGGSFDGRIVAIDPALASRLGRFWRLSSLHGQRRIVGWNPSRLPAPVAFRAGLNISSGDSIAFWRTLRQVEADMGMTLFQPAQLEAGADPDDVIVVDVRPMVSDDGVTLTTWSAHGSVYDARIFLRSRETLHNERVVTHEMMHALGFGHTRAWSSVMNPQAHTTRRLTAEDVAYAQHAIASRSFNEREDMWSRLALAMERGAVPTPSSAECDPFEPPVRFPAECTSYPCSVPSASCGAERNTGPWPER